MSPEVDYISWLERQKERLTFKYNKIKEERDTLKAQKIAFARSYKQVVEENRKLKEEIRRLKGED